MTAARELPATATHPSFAPLKCAAHAGATMELEDLIKQLRAQGYYGELQIKFENGKPVAVKKSDSLKVR